MQVATVEVSPADKTLQAAGESVQLMATARGSDGGVLQGRTFTWSTSNSGVATVGESGLVTAMAPGTAVITASTDGKSGTATITVAQAPVASVTVLPQSASVTEGSSVQFAAEARDAEGEVLTGRAFTWSSSDPAVAQVDGSGRATGIAAGSAVIRARIGEVAGDADLTVTPRPVASVEVSPPAATVEVGATVALTARTFAGDGAELTGKAVTWSSDDAGIASVDASGVVTGVTPGTVTIRATSEGKAGTATIAVVPPPVASVSVLPAAAAVAVGASAQLVAQARDATGEVLSGRTFTWATSDASVATVDATGLVIGVSTGTATITATSEGKSASATITVVAVPVASVTVLPSSATIQAGGTAQLAAEVRDGSGNLLTGRAVAWSSSDPSIASVDATGLVTAVAPGTVTVSASSEGKSGTATITVTPVPVASVVVAPSSASVEQGKTVQLTAQALDGTGKPIAGKTFAWTTGDGSIATVDVTGKVTGVSPGTVTITATSDGKSGSATITVTPVPVASVVVTPSSATVEVGKSTTLAAQAYDADSNPLAGRTMAWSTGDAGIATVDAAGKVVGVSPGTVTITATSEGKSGAATITVVPVSVASVVVSPSSLSVAVGGTAQLSAQALDGDGMPIAGKTFAWSTSDAGIANVDLTGKVTAVAQGTATITATVDGKSGNATVTVTPPVSGVPIDCGDLISASIGLAAEVDQYTFTGSAGTYVAITGAETGGQFASNGSLYPVIKLIASDASTVTTVNANGQQIVQLPLTGSYALRVSANNLAATGSYNLDVECVVPPAAIDGALSWGDLVSGDISAGAKVDLYTVTGTAGDYVAVTLAETGGIFAGNGSLYPVATLIAPDASTVTSVSANGQKIVQLSQSGTYVIKVDANNYAATGTYNLDVQDVLPPDPVDSALSWGDLISGDISAGAKVDVYTVTGTAGDYVAVTLAETGGVFAGNGSLYPVATLIAPDASTVTSVSANGQKIIQLPQSGMYVIKVNANNYAATGTYNLDVQDVLPPDPVDGALSWGDLVSGDISAGAKVDVYTVAGMAGDYVAVTLAETGGVWAGNVALYPVATLIAPDATAVASVNQNGQQVVQLSQTGTYVIKVNANNLAATGTYNVDLQSILPPVPSDGVLSCNAAATGGDISAGAKTDLYTFSGLLGQNVTVTISETGGGFASNGSLYPVATLIAPDGSVVATVNANGSQSVSLPMAGTYVVKVNANNFNATGTYNVSMQCL